MLDVFLKAYEVCNQSWHWSILITKLSKELSHTFCGLQISHSQNLLAEKDKIKKKVQETENRPAVNDFSLLPFKTKIKKKRKKRKRKNWPCICNMSLHFCLRKHPELLRRKTDTGGRRGRSRFMFLFCFFSEERASWNRAVEKYQAWSTISSGCFLLSWSDHFQILSICGEKIITMLLPGSQSSCKWASLLWIWNRWNQIYLLCRNKNTYNLALSIKDST